MARGSRGGGPRKRHFIHTPLALLPYEAPPPRPPDFPDVALQLDSDNDWTVASMNTDTPDGFLVVDTDGDPAADSAATGGLSLGIDTDGDPFYTEE